MDTGEDEEKQKKNKRCLYNREKIHPLKEVATSFESWKAHAAIEHELCGHLPI